MDQYQEITQEDLKAFLADAENQKTAAALALQIRSKFGRKWFTLKELKKVTQHSETLESFDIPVLKAYNLIRAEGGRYRISLTPLERAKSQNRKV
jgi:hypothetical protein